MPRPNEPSATLPGGRAGPLLLAALGLLSAAAGVRSALHPGRSQDFQWSGIHMLLGRVDPWLEFLRGDPLHRILLLQIPNYLPVLYVLLLPFGLLPFPAARAVWAVCNLLFAIAAAVLACRAYHLRGGMVPVTLGLFLLTTPVRNTLGNGQHGLLLLLLWCVALLQPGLTGGRAALAGLGYFKLAFAPPLALFLLVRGGLRALLWSLLLPAVGLALVWLWLTGGHSSAALLQLAVEPLQVARTGFFLRGADINLPDVLDPVLRAAGLGLRAMDTWELLIGSALCAAVFFFGIARPPRSSAPYAAAMLALAGLLLFRHHNYDGVVLLLPLCFALARWRVRQARWLLLVLACPLYGQRVLEAAHISSRWLFVPQFALLVWGGVLLYRLRDVPVGAADGVLPL